MNPFDPFHAVMTIYYVQEGFSMFLEQAIPGRNETKENEPVLIYALPWVASVHETWLWWPLLPKWTACKSEQWGGWSAAPNHYAWAGNLITMMWGRPNKLLPRTDRYLEWIRARFGEAFWYFICSDDRIPRIHNLVPVTQVHTEDNEQISGWMDVDTNLTAALKFPGVILMASSMIDQNWNALETRGILIHSTIRYCNLKMRRTHYIIEELMGAEALPIPIKPEW